VPGPEDVLLAKERCEAVADLVERLPERTRAVVRARYFESLNRADVAKVTGLSERQVKRPSRARYGRGRAVMAAIHFPARPTEARAAEVEATFEEAGISVVWG